MKGASFQTPTRAQEMGWPAIAAGDWTLIFAPTGSGKTLTAFLWALDRLMFVPVPKKELQGGALTDPSALAGRVAVSDIYPGQQLTATAFAYATAGSLQTKLNGLDRAITIQVDASHGMIGQIGAGDHVDVFIGFSVQGAGGTQPVIKLLMADVLVLKAPLAGGSGLITLRAPEYRAAQLAYAADNGRLWLVLRPASGARTVNPGLINAQSLLNSKPVR